jgi:hypothetical protein
MCDYSLHDVASRPAKVGDKLITHKFNTFTRGFAAANEPNVAICLLPGTELAFEQDAEFEHPFRRLLPRFGFGKLGDKVARFRQINLSQQCVHHDALEFPSGKVVLLTRLRPGQRATVLQLPATHQPATPDFEHTARALTD